MPRSSSQRRAAAGALASLTLLSLAQPALADPGRNDPGTDRAPVVDGADPSQGRLPAASSRVDEPGSILAERPGDERILLDEVERPVAPGLELRSVEWLDAGGFMRADVLTADLAIDGLSVDYLFPGQVARTEPLQAQAERADAVAAVNGDFFDINNSGSPHGVGRSRDGLVKGPNSGVGNAVGIDAEGLGVLTRAFLEGQVVLPGGDTAPLEGYNVNSIGSGGIAAYTHLWGSYTRARGVSGASQVREVMVTDGRVTATSTEPGSGVLPEDTIALVGRETGADTLATLRVGDEVEVSYGVRSEEGELEVAIGAGAELLRDGAVVPQNDEAVHPRTAVGFSEDRATMYLVTVDGRMAASSGMNYEDLGAFLLELGADDAFNLDGGGSSTMLAREAGEVGLDVENAPSDGYQRSVANGLALFAEPGSGRLTGMRVIPEADEEDASLLRVFPGLTRDLDALGHDETYAPVDADPRFRVTPAAVGTIDEDGTFTARRHGDATVTASVQSVSDQVDVTVLGDLARMRSTTGTVVLADDEDRASFGLVGYDKDGFQAPIDPDDVTLEYDEDQLTIEPTDQGRFDVTPLADGVGLVVTASVGDVVSHVPVSVGLESQVVAEFDDAAQWRWSGARSTGSLEPVAGRDGGTALQINYDFTRATATRTSNATSPAHIALPGQPQALGLWIRGDGQGQWWSFALLDANGTYHPLYGPHITWTGWRYVEVPVPQGVAFPIRTYRFGIIETSASSQYAGSVAIDDITVKVAPEIDTPASEPVVEPVVVQDGMAVDEGDLAVAVVSDAQFTASDQTLVPAARRTLRDALAADPDLIVINGDWVDTGYPQDLALARQVIEEELGDAVPWYYVPGNHEIYGTNSHDNFVEEFGAAQHSFVHQGTRFVLLSSATGTLQGGGFAQWQMLHEALDDAASDPDVNGVVAMWHHPPHDPGPVQASQMASRVEVAVVERWLAEFRRETGKGAAFVGSHVGAFSASATDGIPYVINGNAAKAPSTSPAEGGFAGWSLVGINPDAQPAPTNARHRAAPEAHAVNPWFEVEMRPTVDALAIDEPGELHVGERSEVRAHVTQGSRTFPVTYPVSADWSASPTIHVGDAGDTTGEHIAAYDPATGELTALRPGSGELTVTVNGQTSTAPVVVTTP